MAQKQNVINAHIKRNYKEFQKNVQEIMKNEEENVGSVRAGDAEEDPFLGRDKIGNQSSAYTMDHRTLNLKLEFKTLN